MATIQSVSTRSISEWLKIYHMFVTSGAVVGPTTPYYGKMSKTDDQSLPPNIITPLQNYTSSSASSQNITMDLIAGSMTIPVTGVYWLNARFGISPGVFVGQGVAYIYIKQVTNGVTNEFIVNAQAMVNSATSIVITATELLTFQAGDVITVEAFQNGSTTRFMGAIVIPQATFELLKAF